MIFTLLAIPFVFFIIGSIGIDIGFSISDRLAGPDVSFRWLMANALALGFISSWLISLAVLCFIWVVAVTA